MQCPRCHTQITTVPDPGGFMHCPGCGARLMTRSTVAKAGPRSASSSNRSAPAALEEPHPSATLPPGTPLKPIPRPGEDTARSATSAARKARASASAPPPAAPPAPEPPHEEPPTTLAAILDELFVLRRMQEEILTLLRPRVAPPGPYGSPGVADEHPTLVPPVRSRQRKSVLLIDDDPKTRASALAAMQQAEVPIRAVESGREALEAIASEKPDVIVLELEMEGELGGRDVINMLKATMDWVDIPIVLYTRSPVESQKEARTVHGADELVSKAAGPEALVARIVALFRRG